MSLAVLAGYAVTYFLIKKYQAKDREIFWVKLDIFVLWTLLLAVIGARLWFVFYHLNYFWVNPVEIFAVWHGGWVWHGALVGGLVASFITWRKDLTRLPIFLDLIAPALALAQAIGRWGNYFNQEAFGRPTSLPWGIPIDYAKRPVALAGQSYFHPTFLYESIFDLGLFFGLWWLLSQFKSMKTGSVFAWYLLLYSLGRFAVEFLRVDEVPIWLGLRAPQWVSLILMAVAVAWLVKPRVKC